MKHKIFCDMDGVICNFGKRFKQYFGETIEEVDSRGDKTFFKKIDKIGYRFWSEMPWQKDGKELWNYILKYEPTILTCPTKYESSRRGKRMWCKENLRSDLIDIILDCQKFKYVQSDTDILIDDNISKIEKWRGSGGIGIHHTDTISTIEKLKELGL